MGIEIEKGFIRMKTVVCDTGPILHLKEANLLNLLEKMGVIYIPRQVDTEQRLSQSSLWISQNILRESYQALDEMFL